MSNNAVIFVLGMLLCWGGLVQATNIDFYNNGTIQTDDVYNTINIWNTAAVSMTGGAVDKLHTNDTSYLGFYNGIINELTSSNSSQADVYGGTIDLLIATGNSIVNLRGGQVHELNAYGDCSIKIYGYDFNWIAPYSSGTLTGSWANGVPFSIYFRGQTQLPENVELVPEPMTVSLMLLGLIAMKRVRP